MTPGDIYSALIAARTDWADYVGNPNFYRDGGLISWHNYQPAMLGALVSPADITKMAEERQYSFQVLRDGGMLRLFYRFERNTLAAACLGFYGVPRTQELPSAEEADAPFGGDSEGEERECGDSDLYPADDFLLSSGAESGVSIGEWIPWLRVDFDLRASRSVLHSCCHLHIAGLDGRIHSDAVPGPRQFIEWVMAIFYPDDYHLHRLGEHGQYANQRLIESVNGGCFPFVDGTQPHTMIRLAVPGRRP